MGKWLVKAESDAPSKSNVLAQTDPDATDDRFPVVVANRPLLRDVRDEKLTTDQEFLDQWLPKLQMIDLRERMAAVKVAFDHLRAAVLAGTGAMGNDWSSSIHRAKGLEATSVLVVATS